MPDRTALLVCPECPYPMHGGGSIRTASILEYLAQNFDVDVVLFQEAGTSASDLPARLLRRVVTLPLPAHSKTASARAARNLGRLARGVVPLCDRFEGHQQALGRWLDGQNYDLAVLEHFWVAAYQPLIRRHARRVVLDLHNVESILLERSAHISVRPQSWALRRFASISRKKERSLLPAFDALWVTSAADAQTPAVRAAAVPIIVYPNALPPSAAPDVAKDFSLAFSGNWSYLPNQSGLHWFVKRVWPTLRARLPGLKLILIGRNAEDARPAVGNAEGIEFTGYVPDALPWIAKAKVAIAPLLAGSGTRLKILEAWAAQVPVVATSIAAEGLAAKPGRDLLIEDSPEGFAQAIVGLLQSPETALRVAKAGRRLFESNYSWPSAWERLAQAGF